MTQLNEDKVRRAARKLSRGKIEWLLERYGFAVYDHETTDELREALTQNILDGTIPVSDRLRE